MSKNKNIYKITLTNGLTPKEILIIFRILKAKEIYFIIARDFSLITEISFLKKLSEESSLYNTSIKFITQKPYFQQILKQQNLEILDLIPKNIPNLKSEKIHDIIGKIQAQKNKTKSSKFSSKQINTKIKSQKDSPSFSVKKIENLKDEKSIRSFFFFLFLILIIGLVFLFLWISPSTTITIKPQISVIPITQNILIKLKDSIENKENLNLPSVNGILVETEITNEETFPSTEKSYELTNAKGKVTLFNETNKKKFFIPSRLSTPDGIIFRTQKNIIIPPKKNNIPGKIVVDIIADPFDSEKKPIGARGNIQPGLKLFFPALRKESQELYYAKVNKGPLVGGSTLTHYFVSENDFELAKPILHESFRIKGIDNLQKELKNRSNRENKKYILLDNPKLLESQLINYEINPNLIGKEQQTFTAKGTVRVSGLVFDQDAIIKVLYEKIKQSQDHRKKLIKVDETSIEYRVLQSDKFKDERWIKLSVSLMGIETLDLKAKSDFAIKWQNNLKKEIAGKSQNEANSILINHPEIKEVLNIKTKPFWVKKIPSILNQINFKINEEI